MHARWATFCQHAKAVKFVANENFPLPSVRRLRELGYDIISISEEDSGISDESVIAGAIESNRTILTFDKDYGELIFRKRYKPQAGVVFLRIDHFQPTEPAEILHTLLSQHPLDFENTFYVYDGVALRVKKYG